MRRDVRLDVIIDSLLDAAQPAVERREVLLHAGNRLLHVGDVGPYGVDAAQDRARDETTDHDGSAAHDLGDRRRIAELRPGHAVRLFAHCSAEVAHRQLLGS
ncbi:hypothetical protein K2Z84_05410 [Candidatus Binatia bacterium]|nr:hypothetical protein [Candidatus Binatia bacterium]